MKNKMLPARAFSPWTISLLIILLLIISIPAYVDYRSTRDEILGLFQDQGQMLAQTIIRSGQNILAFDAESREMNRERLHSYGLLLRQLDSLNYHDRRPVFDYAQRRLRRMLVYLKNDGSPDLQFQMGRSGHMRHMRQRPFLDSLRPIIRAMPDTTQIFISETRKGSPGPPLLLIRRARSRGFMALLPKPEPRGMFNRRGWINRWLEYVSESSSIQFIQLLEGHRVIAEAGRLLPDSSATLAFAEEGQTWQTIRVQGREVLTYQQLGPRNIRARIGFPSDALDHLNSNLVQRLLINSLLLLILVSMFIFYILSRNNYTLLNQRYQEVRTYTGSILQNMQEGIIVANEQGRILIFNRAAEEILALPPGDRQSMKFDALELPFSDGLQKRLRRYEELTESPETINLSGNSRHLLVSAQRIAIESDGEQQQLYIVRIRDNSLQVELEGVRTRKSKLTALGQLASRVAHEIRNPLNGIGVLAQRLQREFQPRENGSEYSQMTGAIRQETSRINTIVESFLAYARTPQLKFSRLDIRSFFNELVPILSSIISNPLQLDLSGETIEADRDQLSRAIINLVKNAGEVSPAGAPVSIRTKPCDGQLHFIIEDNGPGVPPELTDQIFDLYFTTREQGYGIGLSLVEKIVSAHNGRVICESPYQKNGKTVRGARFTLILPLKQVSETA